LKPLVVTFLGLSLLCTPAWAASPTPQPKVVVQQIRIDANTDEKILKSHLKPGDPYRTDCLALLGLQAYDQDHPEQAAAYFQEVLINLKASTRPKLVQVVALAGLGMIEMDASEYTQAQHHLEAALSTADTLEPMYRPMVADIMGRYSGMLQDTGHFNEAKSLLQKALKLDPQCESCQESQETLSQIDQSGDYFADLDRDVVRWNDETRTITVWLGEGQALKDWRPQIQSLAQKALESWNIAMNNRFDFQYVQNSDEADVRFYWRPSAQKDEDGVHTVIGLSCPLLIQGGVMGSNDIWVGLHDLYGRAITDDEIYSTLLHETGHMLGINGHSRKNYDLMAESSEVTTITPREARTMAKVYQAPPTFTNPSDMSLAAYRKKHRIGDPPMP
jgi:predicted Zn-dependent protease